MLMNMIAMCSVRGHRGIRRAEPHRARPSRRTETRGSATSSRLTALHATAQSLDNSANRTNRKRDYKAARRLWRHVCTPSFLLTLSGTRVLARGVYRTTFRLQFGVVHWYQTTCGHAITGVTIHGPGRQYDSTPVTRGRIVGISGHTTILRRDDYTLLPSLQHAARRRPALLKSSTVGR